MHSSLMGGSTCERVIHCPGSVRLSEQFPKRKASPAALLGTALHEVMERLMKDRMMLCDVVGYRAKCGVTITQELFDDKVAPAYVAINKLLIEYDVVQTWFEPVVRFEQNRKIFGSIDVLALTKANEMMVIDYKFGDGVYVDASNNMQLMFYAAAAYHDPNLKLMFNGAQGLIFGIIQPLSHKSDPVDLCEYPGPVADILEPFTRHIFNAVDQIDDDDPAFAEGKWCRWCQAMPTCPVKLGIAKHPSTLRITQYNGLKEALMLIERLKEWIKAVEALALDQMEKGIAFPSHKIVDKRITRKWGNETRVIDAVRKSSDLDVSEVTRIQLKSPAQIETLCKKRGVDFSIFEDLVVQESSGQTLVAASDKRPESDVAVAARMEKISNS